MTTISVCLISKNESQYLSRWLGNVSCFADEIIIVDTGSTDESLTLIEPYPRVRLEHYLWGNDFSAARNFALSLANMEWILILDADEYIPDYRKIRTLVENREIDGYEMSITNFQPEDSLTVFETTSAIRLFRNSAGIEFRGVIQESIDASIQEVGGTIKRAMAPTIHHDGYRSDVVQGIDSRRLRNIRLLTKALEREPDNSYYLYQLGLCHKILEPQLLETYLLQALEKGGEQLGTGAKAQIHMRLAQYYLDCNDISLTIEQAERCLTLDPNNLVAHSCQIISLIQEGRLDEALPFIDFVTENGKGVLSNWSDILRLGEICRSELERVRSQT